jgi:hypothetical protein
VCVEEFTYKADGGIPMISMTTSGPKAVENLNPFVQQEAETIAFSAGLKTEVCSEGGMDVTMISNGDYIKVKSVDFGPGIVSFDARVASAGSGGTIELHLDSQTGTMLGSCAVPGTGGAQTWMTKTCPVSGATGVHDLFFKFTGGSGNSLFNFNWWKFTSVDGSTGAGGGSGSGGGSVGTAGKSGSGSGGSGSGGVAGTGGRGGAQAPGTGGASGSGGSGGSSSGGSGGTTASGGTKGGSGGSTGISSGGTSGSASGGVNGGASGGASGNPSASGGSGSPGPGANDDSGGCTCQTSGSEAATPLATLLALAALLPRRRARPRRQP